MISKHCGYYMTTYTENKLFFTKECQVCGKHFTQRKRQPKK